MNEFERRVLDLAQNHVNLRKAAAEGNSLSIVEYYGYTIQIGSPTNTIAPSAAAQGIIPIQSDSWFVMSYISATVQKTDPDTLQIANDFSLQITDTGAGKVLYSTPLNAAVLIGTNTPLFFGIPFLLTVPRVIRPNTNIKFDIVNLGGETFRRVFITLMGARVYTL